MKWVNHITIGGAICASFNPPLVPVAILGSTAPDWLEWVSKAVGHPIKHRTTTHYVSLWAFGMIFAQFVWDLHGILFWFCAGGLSHVLADSLTISGVPLGWWSDRKFHLFGGRIRTGQPGEYFVAWGIVALTALFAWNFGSLKGDVGFVPFFYNWADLYQTGVIDGYEWKMNRFRLF